MKFNTYNTFLEKPSSGTHKVKILENQIIQKHILFFNNDNYYLRCQMDVLTTF